MIKLLIIGLDGATFNVIEPLCDEGKLPTLTKLMTGGVYGTLESTFPPVTGPAWTSLATGKNPGKTGIFDFRNLVAEEGFEFKLVTSAEIKREQPYWDYLSNAGIEVGVVNYPLLFPPYKINGIMVSGLGSAPHDDICYPREFKKEMLNKCGHYRIDVPWHDPRYKRNPSLFVQDVFELLEVNQKTLELLLGTSLQVLTFVISATDFAQHYMWKYIDPSHTLYQKEEAQKYGQAFVEIWQRIDGILDMALEALPQDANVFIVSDHGFGPHLSSFCINSWLCENGYLLRRNRIASMRRLQHLAARTLQRVLPSLSTRLSRLSARGEVPKIPFTSEIDLDNSLAFSPINSNVAGQIYLNRQAALFKEKRSHLEIKEEIIKKLKETCENLGLRINLPSREEIYHGDYVNLAADIIFEIDDFECSIKSGFDEKTFRRPPLSPTHTGIHKKEGVFIAYGADVKKAAKIEGTTIYDIAPTILHIAGLPVPKNMDGRVLLDILKEGSEPMRRIVQYGQLEDGKQEVKDRIKRLKKSSRF